MLIFLNLVFLIDNLVVNYDTKKHSDVCKSIRNKWKEVAHNTFLHQILDNSAFENLQKQAVF